MFHTKICVKQNNKKFHTKKNVCETKTQNVSHKKIMYVKQNDEKFHTEKNVCETKR